MEVSKQAVNFDADSKLLEFIDRKLEKLEVFFDKIVSADVILKLENNGQVKDKIAEIKINVPGATLISKECSKSFEESVDLGASAMKRQLIKHKEKQKK